MSAVDWNAVRAGFPALENWTYLNSATFGQLPRRTVEAIAAHFAHRDEQASWDYLNWFDDHDRLRAKLARLIGGAAADIAFIPNASSALALLLHGVAWQPGDEVLILEGEFPNNIYAPAVLERRGVVLRQTAWERFYAALTARTRLVVLSTVNYSTGFRPPLEEMAAELRRRGVLLLVDATQSLGALRFDWARVEPDLLAVNCYKWMLAPNGAAFMAVHPRLRERLEPHVVGWRSHEGWRNVDNLHQGRPVFPATAEKYEGGMLASPVLYGLEASVDLFLELGPAAIEARVLELAAACRKAVGALGGETLPYANSAIVAARFAGRDAVALNRALKAERVVTSARHGWLRLSWHFYNNAADLEALTAALRRLL